MSPSLCVTILEAKAFSGREMGLVGAILVTTDTLLNISQQADRSLTRDACISFGSALAVAILTPPNVQKAFEPNPVNVNDHLFPLACFIGNQSPLHYPNESRIINLESCYFGTPLMATTVAGNLDIMKTLVDMGALKGQSYHIRKHPLTLAANSGHFEIVKFLLEHIDTNNKLGSSTPLFEDALCNAAQSGYKNIMEYLIQSRKEKLDSPNALGNALLCALYGKHEDIALWLISKGADVYYPRDGGRQNVSLVAAERGFQATVAQLLDMGVPADYCALPARISNTPLAYAASFGHADVVRLLLMRGALPNRQSRQIGLALHAAAVSNHIEAAEILLKYGADPNLYSSSSFPIYHSGSPLEAAIVSGFIEMTTLLLDAGAQVDGICSGARSGLGTLAVACMQGHCDLVRILLTRGASVEYCNTENQRPMDIAIAESHYNIVNILLEAGAEPATEKQLSLSSRYYEQNQWPKNSI
jgi:ankyrin repeat protein